MVALSVAAGTAPVEASNAPDAVPGAIERIDAIRDGYIDALKDLQVSPQHRTGVAQFPNFPNFPNFANFPNFPNFHNWFNGWRNF